MRRVSYLLMFLMLATNVWAETQDVEFAGSTFQPEVYKIKGQAFYNTEDDEVKRLLGRANITFQWSSSGHTLFAFAPGRESYWTAGENTVKVNNQVKQAPGRLIIRRGSRYIQPEALFYALATRGAETPNGFQLFPVITQIAQDDTGFLLRSASKARPKVSTRGESTVFSIKGFSWDGASSMMVGDTQFEFKGGADQGYPLEVVITPPTFFAADFGGTTLLNETKIDVYPAFPGAENSNKVALTEISDQESEGLPMLVMDFDGGAKAHYIRDEQTGDIKIYIPKASDQARAFRSANWPGLEVSTFQTGYYPVLEISIPAGNSSYEFVKLENSPTTLALLRGPNSRVEDLAISGSVETPGWAQIRGTIVLDPGHGGSDPGCISRHHGTREADITLRICKHLAQILRSQGWKVIMTRNSDRDVTYAGSPDRQELEARSGIANKLGADLFMSVHCNASVNPGSQGSSIHWWKAEDHAFAQSLEPVLGSAIGLGDKGLIRNRFVVLRHAQMPSVLVETAFLSNSYEGGKLSDSRFQKVIAQQLAGGLANYMRGSYASRGHRSAE